MYLASVPGLPSVQLLSTCRIQKQREKKSLELFRKWWRLPRWTERGRGLFVLFLSMNRSSKHLQKQNPFHSLFRRKNKRTKHIFVNETPPPLHAYLVRHDIINLMKWTPPPLHVYIDIINLMKWTPPPLHVYIDIINLINWTPPPPVLAHYEWPKQLNEKPYRCHTNTLTHCRVGATPTKAAEHIRLHFRVLYYDYNRLPISWV